jgi:hypothetical protein|tara:strand:+ start:452 stop:721 length:270 start_codon:yes stop_codon:yes gene_type:complete
MKVKGLMKKARWESIPCICGTEVMDSYPIKECLHCCFDERFQSIPKKDFTVVDDQYDKQGKLIKKQTKTVKEVTLVRGKRFDDVIGWTY